MPEMEEIIHKMLLIRLVEEEIIARYGKQQMRCPVHLSIGQEAIAVGVCNNLRNSDMVFSTHRCHAHYLAKGGSLERMALELHGKIGGCLDGRGGSMHLCDDSVGMTASIPIVASAIPLAVGAALANKIKRNGNTVVCFFGDAAVEEGVFHESMNFAALHELPIIFICENNRLSVDTPLEERQPLRLIKDVARAHHIPHFQMCGDNVFDIASVVRRDVAPYLYVFNTQRSHVHCGTDTEFKLAADPIAVAIKESGVDYLYIRGLKGALRDKINEAFDAAEEAQLPTPEMAMRYMYA